MNPMFIVGTICWFVASFFGVLYQYECQDRISKKGIVLKALSASCIVAYAIVLIVMFGKSTDAAYNFAAGLVMITIADTLVAYLEYTGEGTSRTVVRAASGNSSKDRILLCVIGILFVVSYFLEVVAFIKGISHHADVSDYIAPFLIFFLLPPIFTGVGALLSKFRIPDAELRVFIIGAFYILLASALFSASTIFALSLFRVDVMHATWILFGSIIFFLSLLLVELRYARPEMHDKKPMRIISRLMQFLGRMILAGCAYLL